MMQQTSELARSATVEELPDPSSTEAASPGAVGGTGEAYEIIFNRQGDFAALTDAENFLKARGFSHGPLQGSAPIGVMLGIDHHVPKWRYLGDMQEWLHGIIDSDNYRAGPVILRIREDAPEAVIEAFRRSP